MPAWHVSGPFIGHWSSKHPAFSLLPKSDANSLRRIYMARYVSHARNMEELRLEFLSDIDRRLDHMDQALKQIRPNASEAARIARARMELLAMRDYWREIDLKALNEETVPIRLKEQTR